MLQKYYYLLIFLSSFVFSKGYVHLLERVVASFEEKPIYKKSCENCKYFIENDNIEFGRCSKFMKPKNRQKYALGQEYKPPLVKHIKVNYSYCNDKDKSSALLLFYLARTCRNNETMCGLDAKYYERKFSEY